MARRPGPGDERVPGGHGKHPGVPDPSDFSEAVLDLVETIPPGRVTTYGAIADALGRGGPRQVGAVMAAVGGSVPWWRVVRADGSLPGHLHDEAHARHLREGTPLRESGKVDLRRAFVLPGQ